MRTRTGRLLLLSSSAIAAVAVLGLLAMILRPVHTFYGSSCGHFWADSGPAEVGSDPDANVGEVCHSLRIYRRNLVLYVGFGALVAVLGAAAVATKPRKGA